MAAKEPVDAGNMNLDKIVPDTSIIIEGILSDYIQKKKITPGIIIIHEAVVAELEAQANRGREIGYQGIDEIKKLRVLAEKQKIQIEFKGSRPDEFEIKFAKTGEIDSLIRELARTEEATLITADKVQSMIAEGKGIPVLLIEFEDEPAAIAVEKYFTKNTISLHLREGQSPMIKEGLPGRWVLKPLGGKHSSPLSKDDLHDLAKELVKEAKSRSEFFIEADRKGSTLLQMDKFRIVITRPPLSDAYEITAVRPIKILDINDYSLSEKLAKRVRDHAEGVLIAGPPGHGKSTFAQALALEYHKRGMIVKTLESPRDLVLPEGITQYSLGHSNNQEITDILLLSRPDYTIFDEMRSTQNFSLYSDLRLSGVGMIGVIHATKPIDAIQRFIGRIELGVIPHVIDTVVFIRDGKISKTFSVSLQIKVPSGMYESDLARPVVTVHDFESGMLEFEIYSYGEQTVVVPVSRIATTPAQKLAQKFIEDECSKLVSSCSAEMVCENKAVLYVPDDEKRVIIGEGGRNIEKLERTLGVSIEVKGSGSPGRQSRKQDTKKVPVKYEVRIEKKNIIFNLEDLPVNTEVEISVDGEFLMNAKSSKKSDIKIGRSTALGKIIETAVKDNKKIELKV